MKQVSNNTLLAAVAIIGLVALAGLIFPKFTEPVSQPTAGGSAAGTTFTSPKIAAIGVTTASSTSASLYNSDSRDRIIEDISVVLDTPNSYGTTTDFLLQAATTTGPSTLGGNTNYVWNSHRQYSLAGGFLEVASSTPANIASTTGAFATRRVWKAGSYLNFVISSSTSYESHVNGGGTDLQLGSTTSGVIKVLYTTR